MNTKDRKITFLAFVNMMCMAMFLVWFIVPKLRLTYAGGTYNYIIFLIIAVWVATSFLMRIDWFMRLPTSMLYLSFFLLMLSLYAAVGFGTDIRATFKLMMSFWFIPYAYYFYQIYGNKSLTKWIVYITVISFLITLVTTFNGLRLYPGASKVMSNAYYVEHDRTAAELYSIFVDKNIGSADFIYALVLCLPFLLIILKPSTKAKKRSKVIALTVLTLAIITIFNSAYTTSMLLSFLALAISFIIGRGVLAYTFAGLLTILAYLSKEFIANVGVKFAVWLNSDSVYTRFAEIAQAVSGDGVAGDLGSRNEFWGNSVNTFINHPLFGVGGVYYTDLSVVGSHSEWFDSLARYGILGNVLIWGFMFYFARSVYLRYKGTPYAAAYTSAFFLACIHGFFNQLFILPTISVVLFFLLPSIGDVVERSNQKAVVSTTFTVRSVKIPNRLQNTKAPS